MTRVQLGDAVAGLRSLSPGSIDLVLTDLPAGITQAPFDRVPDLPAFFEASWQALRPNGAIVAMAANLRFAMTVVAAESRWYRYDIIWRKGRAGGFLNAGRQPLRGHEFILLFYRRQCVYNPQMTRGHDPVNSNAGRRSTGVNYGAAAGGKSRAGATDRHPVSVIATPTVGTTCSTRTHPQQKPPELLEWLVATYTNEGDQVVDPYAGSGSTGHACAKLGRPCVLWDDTFGAVG